MVASGSIPRRGFVGTRQDSVFGGSTLGDGAGAKALKVRSSPGRPMKLEPAQRCRLLRLLLKGRPAGCSYHPQSLDHTLASPSSSSRSLEYAYHRDRLMHSLHWERRDKITQLTRYATLRDCQLAARRNFCGPQAIESPSITPEPAIWNFKHLCS